MLSFQNVNAQDDKTILRTDSKSNILGGDKSDWNFDEKAYSKMIKSGLVFFTPVFKDSNYILIPELQSFFYELKPDGVLLKWFTDKEKNIEGFYIERAEYYNEYQQSNNWKPLGFVNGAGNSDKQIEYKFLDRDTDEFRSYLYRLKQIDFSGNYEYFSLSNIVTAYPVYKTQFFPVFPNPVNDNLNVRFYLESDDVVSLYFLDKNDTTYIMNHEAQKAGFYEFSVDKNSLGYKNEMKRLYIDCESCDKGKNYGDILFK